jgi:hypothetical protein
MKIKQRIFDSISYALWDSELISSRIILAMGELFWAIMLFWNGDTFSRPTYSHMAEVMSENCWAILFLFSATIQIGIVLSDKLHSTFARYFAFWNMLLWCYTVVSMLLSVYPPPAAIGGEIAIAISAMWIWIRPYILVEGYRRAAQ